MLWDGTNYLTHVSKKETEGQGGPVPQLRGAERDWVRVWLQGSHYQPDPIPPVNPNYQDEWNLKDPLGQIRSSVILTQLTR